MGDMYATILTVVAVLSLVGAGMVAVLDQGEIGLSAPTEGGSSCAPNDPECDGGFFWGAASFCAPNDPECDG